MTDHGQLATVAALMTPTQVRRDACLSESTLTETLDVNPSGTHAQAASLNIHRGHPTAGPFDSHMVSRIKHHPLHNVSVQPAVSGAHVPQYTPHPEGRSLDSPRWMDVQVPTSVALPERAPARNASKRNTLAPRSIPVSTHALGPTGTINAGRSLPPVPTYSSTVSAASTTFTDARGSTIAPLSSLAPIHAPPMQVPTGTRPIEHTGAHGGHAPQSARGDIGRHSTSTSIHALTTPGMAERARLREQRERRHLPPTPSHALGIESAGFPHAHADTITHQDLAPTPNTMQPIARVTASASDTPVMPPSVTIPGRAIPLPTSMPPHASHDAASRADLTLQMAQLSNTIQNLTLDVKTLGEQLVKSTLQVAQRESSSERRAREQPGIIDDGSERYEKLLKHRSRTPLLVRDTSCLLHHLSMF
jgi:hypothetical protein